ncbi:MAG: aspartate carbamoyltransferase catalytic subunit [Phycisphaeraceae bacterium]|nr:aspartate carbamoyltransferase catalytic subunit [Phycisphaeraceae bacterium]
MSKDFLQLEGLPRAELEALLEAAGRNLAIAEQKVARRESLTGRVVANMFFEDSTRTRCSFETAVHRLGGEVFNLGESGSSTRKGETLVDTALNVEAMGVSAIVVRTSVSGGAALVARRVRCPVINAGDGRHEHPTQGLLDLLTLREAIGSIEGRSIAIVGDIANSRVARSAIHGLSTFEARIKLVGPPTLVGEAYRYISGRPDLISIHHDLDLIIPELDAIMMLRIQNERASGNLVAGDYRQMYGLTPDRASRLPGHAIVLHPGPVNRGVEIDDTVADDLPRSRILRQVTQGVAARMAVLERLLGVAETRSPVAA